MPSPRSIFTKLRPATAIPYLRRIVRWYLAPSGLLLAAALGLMLLASLGLGPSRVFAFLGVALMAVFLPYRFSRQQGFAFDQASAIEAQSVRSQQELSRRITALSLRSKRQLVRQIEAQSARSQQELARAVSGLVKTQSDTREIGRVHTERIGREVEVLQTRFALAEELLDAISDRHDHDAETWRSWSQQISALQQEISEIRALVDAKLPALGTQVSTLSEQVVANTERGQGGLVESGPMTHALDGALAREGLSGSTTAAGFQQFDRVLSAEDRVELRSWCSTLGLNVSDRALSYIAHEIRVTEDALLGRMAGSLGSAVLRSLVLRSVDTRSPHVLEIGSLFGISIAALERSTFGIFDPLTFTAIDPLDGYYKTADLDILTGVPVSQPVFEENMRRAGIDESRVRLVRHLSTEEAAIHSIDDSSVDMLFIDGDHTRYGVECDFRNFVAKVRPTGYIVFDDYQAKAWPDVEEFVDDVVMQRDDLIFIGAGWETAVFRVVAR